MPTFGRKVRTLPEAATQTHETLSLRARQALLVSCLGKLFAYAEQRGYQITLGEGYVQSERKSRSGPEYTDGVHMHGSLHYSRLAQDLNLFIDGLYISNGDHWAWADLSDKWESLHPLCRAGRRFGDANHLSIAYDGKA